MIEAVERSQSRGAARSRRIVLTTFGSFGDLNPYLGLAIGLRARGHRPVLATMPFYRSVVEREGIEFHPVRPDGDPSDRQLLARVMDARRGSEYVIRDVMMAHLRDTYDDLLPVARSADLLVSHPITFATPVVAERLGLPWASGVLAPMSFFSRFDLPVFPNAPWVKGLERVPGMARALVAVAHAASRRWVRDVDRLRAEEGLARGAHPVFEGQHAPGLVLALFSSVLARPQPDWPPNTTVTGPVWYNGATPPGLDDGLEDFLQAGPPPVVFTLGTSAVNAPGSFYEESVAAAVRTGVRAVLLVGRYADNRPTGPLPDTIKVVDAAPHAALMPRACAVVHQGGAGTLHQALRAGVPMLVVPHAHDQADNAWRAVALGVGRSLPPARYRAPRVADELRRLTKEPGFAARAAEVGAVVAQQDGVAAACDAIDGLLARV
jgi:rhamnosyltransferase subunit B